MVIKTDVYHRTLMTKHIPNLIIPSAENKNYDRAVAAFNQVNKIFVGEKIFGNLKLFGDYFEKKVGEDFFYIDIQQLVSYDDLELGEKIYNYSNDRKINFLSFSSGKDENLIPPWKIDIEGTCHFSLEKMEEWLKFLETYVEKKIFLEIKEKLSGPSLSLRKLVDVENILKPMSIFSWSDNELKTGIIRRNNRVYTLEDCLKSTPKENHFLLVFPYNKQHCIVELYLVSEFFDYFPNYIKFYYEQDLYMIIKSWRKFTGKKSKLYESWFERVFGKYYDDQNDILEMLKNISYFRRSGRDPITISIEKRASKTDMYILEKNYKIFRTMISPEFETKINIYEMRGKEAQIEIPKEIILERFKKKNLCPFFQLNLENLEIISNISIRSLLQPTELLSCFYKACKKYKKEPSKEMKNFGNNNFSLKRIGEKEWVFYGGKKEIKTQTPNKFVPIILFFRNKEKEENHELNVFEKFVQNNSGKRGLNLHWDMKTLSKNPSISSNLVEKNLNGIGGEPWHILELSQNPSINSKLFRDHPEWKWNLQELLEKNPSMVDYVDKYGEKGFESYEMPWKNILNYISLNPGFTLEFFEKHLDWDWNIDIISANHNLSFKFVEKYPDLKWNVFNLSMNPNIPEKLIEEHSDWEWDIHYLSMNPNITPEFIERHPEIVWDITILSKNPAITESFIENHPEVDWTGSEVCQNPSISAKFALENFPDSMQFYSINKNLTENFILAHPTVLWNKQMISRNPSISAEFLIKNKKYLDVKNLCLNPGLTFNFIENHPEIPWDINLISGNNFPVEIKKDSKLTFLLAENKQKLDNPISRFGSDYFYDKNINKIIFDYLKTPEKNKKNIILNEYERFIKNNLHRQWNMDNLSSNPLITSNFVQLYPNGIENRPWNIDLLSENPSISLEFIKQNYNKGLDWKWNMKYISKNPKIIPFFFEKNRDWNWDMKYLSKNPAIISPDFVEKHPGLHWDVGSICQNTSITTDFIENHPEMDWENKINMEYLSANPSIRAIFVEKFDNWNWNLDNIAKNPGIKEDFFQRHIELKWNGHYLSMNPNITPEFIEKNPQFSWNGLYLSSNPNITGEFVDRNPQISWVYDYLFINPAITGDFVLRHMDKNPGIFAGNENITQKFIEDHPEIKWDIKLLNKNYVISPYFLKQIDKIDAKYLSLNPSLTIDFIEENRFLNWDLDNLSKNTFIKREPSPPDEWPEQ